MRPKLFTSIALIVIVLVGLYLRLYKLDFGMELPYLAHTDEPTQYDPAIGIIHTGDLNPHFFRYPSLPIYLYSAVLYAGYGLGRLFGVFSSLADVQPIHILQMSVGIVGTPSLLLLGRATSALFGTLTILFTLLLARSLARRRWTPLLAALLLALSRAHVRLSHYMTVDVMATFFAIACVTLCTLALTRRETRLLWAAAVCGGLATSCKYNYALLALPVALACWLDPVTGWANRIKRTVASGVLFVLAFVLTSPFVLLDWTAAWKGISAELQHYASGHMGVTGSSAVFYLRYLWDVNPFYLLLGVPGLGLALWSKRRVAAPMVAFVLLFFWFIGRQAVHFDRNVLPVMVLLIVSASIAPDVLLGRLPFVRDNRAGRKRWASWAIAALVLIPLLPSLWELPALLAPPQPSGKARAQAWFDETLHTAAGQRYLSRLGSRSLRILGEAYTVYLDPAEVDVEYVATVTRVERSGRPISGPKDLAALGYDVVLLGSAMYHRFYTSPEVYAAQVAVYDAFFDGVSDVLGFEQEDDLLAFRGQGMRVYAFFVSARAREFLAEMTQ